jgi:Family of unknown function (DUF6338)
MISTFSALAVAVVALLPGALYTWAFERNVGAWGASLSDRLLRFVGVSAVFHASMAWPDYLAYNAFIRSGDLSRGVALPPWVWVIPPVYVGLPLLLGGWVGRATHKRKSWTRFLVGKSPAPRAWDHLFADAGLNGYVIIHRKEDKPAIAGVWSRSKDGQQRSYASGYPDVQEIFLFDTLVCDPQTGALEPDEHGNVQLRGVGVLIAWDSIAYLEFARV